MPGKLLSTAYACTGYGQMFKAVSCCTQQRSTLAGVEHDGHQSQYTVQPADFVLPSVMYKDMSDLKIDSTWYRLAQLTHWPGNTRWQLCAPN